MTLIIAEAGVNHNGDEALAVALIDAAHRAGVDVVKFQTFKAANLVTRQAKQAAYQTANTGKEESQFAMLSRLELSFDAHLRLIAHCESLGIEFLSTAFDTESLDFLVNQLKLQTLKIPSGELTNAPFVLAHARTGCELIVSTGMATLAEVEAALGVIAFGLTAPQDAQPGEAAFMAAYASEAGQAALANKVTLLHCTTEYPAPMVDINLKAIDTLSHAFRLPVGYSDHSQGITIPVAAVARGACLIEKHFTLDRKLPGPDHAASLEPAELAQMVDAIRRLEVAMGSAAKAPNDSEWDTRAAVRKQVVAARPIKAGQRLERDDLATARTGEGLGAEQLWDLVGSTAKLYFNVGDNL